MVARFAVAPVLVLLLTALAVAGSAQPLHPEPRAPGDRPMRPSITVNGRVMDGAGIRLTALALHSIDENGHRLQDPQAVADPIRRVDFQPPASGAAPEASGLQSADPLRGRRVRRVPNSTSYVLLGTGLAGVALSRRCFKR